MEEGNIRKVRKDLGREDEIKMMQVMGVERRLGKVIEEEGELRGEVGWESGNVRERARGERARGERKEDWGRED